MNEGLSNIRELPNITAIVAAYNEEETVFNVVQFLSMHSFIDQVIVINDGSTDNTKSVLDAFNTDPHVTIINLEENRGKGNALAIGIEQARDGMLVFVDADVKNLTECHIASVVNPLLSDKADMVLGYPVRYPRLGLVYRYIKRLTGTRALWRKDMYPLVNTIRNIGYGVEAMTNYAMRKKRVIVFELTGLHHVSKIDKKPFPIWIFDYLDEGLEIAGAMLPVYYSELRDRIVHKKNSVQI